MDNKTRNASAAIVAALAVATISSPAAAAPVSAGKDVVAPLRPAIVVDALGNLSLAGMTSDDALALAYGAGPEDVRRLLADVNIGSCKITNNCKPPIEVEDQA